MTLFFSVCLLATVTAFAESIKPLDRAIVIVNGEVITQSEFASYRKEMGTHPEWMPRVESPMSSEALLESMIDRTLQLQQATKMHITIAPEEVDRVIQSMAEAHHVSVSDFEGSLLDRGWTLSSFRQSLEEALVLRRLHESVVLPIVTVSDLEVLEFVHSPEYQQEARSYHVHDTLTPVPEGASSQEWRAALLRARETAIEGPSDLGWKTLSQIPALFQPVIRGMRAGEVSAPIRAPNGWHVLRLLGARSGESDKIGMEVETRKIFIGTASCHLPEDGNPVLSACSKKLTEVLSQLQRKKIDFRALAQRYSEEPELIRGSVSRALLTSWPIELQPAIAALKGGEISAPLKSDSGWTIVQLISKREIPLISGEKLKEIQQWVFERKAQEAVREFVSELKSRAHIVRMTSNLMSE